MRLCWMTFKKNKIQCDVVTWFLPFLRLRSPCTLSHTTTLLIKRENCESCTSVCVLLPGLLITSNELKTTLCGPPLNPPTTMKRIQWLLQWNTLSFWLLTFISWQLLYRYALLCTKRIVFCLIFYLVSCCANFLFYISLLLQLLLQFYGRITGVQV